jgi:O-antigen/teichoic acid export membrane protein
MAAEAETNEAAPPRSGLLRTVLGDMGYYVPAQILSSLLSVGSMALFTRLLDRTQYGSYALVLSAATMVQQFAFSWLQQSGLRFWAGRSRAGEDARDTFLSSLHALFGLATVVSIALWPVLVPLLLPGVPWTTAAVGLAIVFAQSAVTIIQARTRAVRQLRSYFLYSVLPSASVLVIGAAAIVGLGSGPVGLLVAVAAASLIVVAAELARNPREFLPGRFRPSRHEVVELARFGLPMLASTIGGVVLDMSDRFLIARYYGVGVAGVYTVANNIGLRVDALTISMISAAFPLLIREYEDKRPENAGRELSRLITVYCSFFVPACTGMALVAGPLTAVMLGREFRDAGLFLAPLMPGVFFTGLHHYVVKPFGLAAENRPTLVIVTLSAAVNVALNLLLLRRMGPVIAGWTTSFSLLVMTALTYRWSRRFLPYRLDWAGLARIAGATAVMVASVLAVGFVHRPAAALTVRVAVGAGSYLVAALALDVVGGRALAARFYRRLRRSPTG